MRHRPWPPWRHRPRRVNAPSGASASSAGKKGRDSFWVWVGARCWSGSVLGLRSIYCFWPKLAQWVSYLGMIVGDSLKGGLFGATHTLQPVGLPPRLRFSYVTDRVVCSEGTKYKRVFSGVSETARPLVAYSLRVSFHTFQTCFDHSSYYFLKKFSSIFYD